MLRTWRRTLPCALGLGGLVILLSGCGNRDRSAQTQNYSVERSPIAASAQQATTPIASSPVPTDSIFRAPVRHELNTTIQSTFTSTPTYTPNPIIVERATLNAMSTATGLAVLTEVATNPTFTPRPTRTTGPTHTPVPLPLGIIPNGDYGIHVCSCGFEDHWRAIVNRNYLEVWAGGYSQPPNQGLVMVITRSLDRGPSSRTFYSTPLAAGSVHVVSVEGLMLTLATQSGEQFKFDASSRQWLSSTPLPSASVVPNTPSPTP